MSVGNFLLRSLKAFSEMSSLSPTLLLIASILLALAWLAITASLLESIQRTSNVSFYQHSVESSFLALSVQIDNADKENHKIFRVDIFKVEPLRISH